MRNLILSKKIIFTACFATITVVSGQSYKIVGTGATSCYDTLTIITCPTLSGDPYYGQFHGTTPGYHDNGDGTVTDNITGLMWQKSPDRNGDGIINFYDKLTYSEALDSASTCITGGYHDWRLPTIKELYSLAMFSGTDPNPQSGSKPVPFIDTSYFVPAYGDTNSLAHGDLANERIIDAQFVTSSLYAGTTMNGVTSMFGFNFSDGRIKGYPTVSPVPEDGQTKHYYVRYVRANNAYGTNQFVDNADGTISGLATGLMWMKNDNGTPLKWKEALSYAVNSSLAGHTDWRLPDVKELQSIVDYSRCPSTTNSAAIDTVFNCTQITNEAGNADYPWYWSSTTFCEGTTTVGKSACYVCFGRAMGYMNNAWLDVHGAGAQRSDPKGGSLSSYTKNGNGYYNSQAPQGDAVRIYNYVRLVRNISSAAGLDDLYLNQKVNIYPNPANDKLFIILPKDMEQAQLSLINTLGQKILQTRTSNLDVSNIPNGIYFLNIRTEKYEVNKKVIIDR